MVHFMFITLIRARFLARLVQKGRKTIASLNRRGKATEKQQQKKNKKQNFSLKNDDMKELAFCIFSAHEATQVEAGIRPQVAGNLRVKVLSGNALQSTSLAKNERRIFRFLSLDFVASLLATHVSDCSNR